MIRDGIATVILGVPNVGKSSLMNVLTREERSIVDAQAGTTRDLVTEYVSLGALTLRLTDTAGIRNAAGVEGVGVSRAKQCAETADLILFVTDGSADATDEELDLLGFANATAAKVLVLLNKSDLGIITELDGLAVSMTDVETAREAVTAAICALFDMNDIQNAEYITNTRHIAALDRAVGELSGVHSAPDADIMSQIIRSAVAALMEITGEAVGDDVVEAIFGGFCIGK
jgi:tRNA modification GTPase